jgi:HSP20 family protein
MTRQTNNHGLPSRSEVDSLVSRRAGAGPRPGRWLPSLDLIEEPGAYVVEIDMPGVRLQDLSIGVSGRRLTLSGRREIVREHAGPQIRVRERWSGTFSRSLELPGPVDAAHLTTTMREGILCITLPKQGAGR